MRLRTTSGQATLSVVLMLMGKTTDFLATYLLKVPPQYVVMTYFSSALAYINGIQVSCTAGPVVQTADKSLSSRENVLVGLHLAG